MNHEFSRSTFARSARYRTTDNRLRMAQGEHRGANQAEKHREAQGNDAGCDNDAHVALIRKSYGERHAVMAAALRPGTYARKKYRHAPASEAAHRA